MFRFGWVMFLCLMLAAPVMTRAEEPAEDDEEGMTAELFMASLELKSGQIKLPNGIARLDLPEDFRYIGPEDAQRFLEDAWGNPNGEGTLGMLLPMNTDLFGDQGWAVVITYDDEGYVSDEDAAELDYQELLASMQAETEAANEHRAKEGYETVSLVGWAAQPHYDAQAKKLYWAKELKFGDSEESTLNYNVRILGRKGVLILNAVSDMSQLPVVEKDMTQVLAFTNFQEGHRYVDFDPSIDKVAGYGVAALIGGKIAAKVGLLSKIGVILLAGKKFVILALGGIAVGLGKLFRRRKIIADPTQAPEA